MGHDPGSNYTWLLDVFNDMTETPAQEDDFAHLPQPLAESIRDKAKGGEITITAYKTLLRVWINDDVESKVLLEGDDLELITRALSLFTTNPQVSN